jgi:hypothetical protein
MYVIAGRYEISANDKRVNQCLPEESKKACKEIIASLI